MKKYYVYQHIRLDKNEIFYIGIGTKTPKRGLTFRSLYNRAHKKSKSNRNSIWQNIVSKSEYRIEIIFETDEYNEAKNLEIQLIEKYGRIKEGGILSNITSGGDGTLGTPKLKGKDSKFSKPVYQYSLSGDFIKEWGCAYEIKEVLGISPNQICVCCNNDGNKKYKTAKGYQWKYYKENKIDSVSTYCSKKVYQYDNENNLINEWNSIREIIEFYPFFVYTSISSCLNGRTKTYKKMKWLHDKIDH